jgi:hypothetical protein
MLKSAIIPRLARLSRTNVRHELPTLLGVQFMR